MIKDETFFLECDPVPDAMRERFDLHWIFVGEVKTNVSTVACHCTKCMERPLTLRPTIVDHIPVIVELRGYMFITDDMIKVVVYFGWCDQCKSVYWARSGPPFRRARALVQSL